MNLPGSEAKKRIAAYVFGAVALLAVWYIYDEMWGGPSAPAPSAAPAAVSAPAANRPVTAAGPEAKTLGKTSASLDPTLHMESMLVTEAVTYDGTGRNIFSASSAPPPPPVNIPKPVAAVRPVAVVAPPPPQPTGPPPPPPIDLKFYGFFETPGTSEKRAILVHGDDQALAAPGQIVFRRYRVVTISPRSIQVEDMPYSNTQTLPLQAD